MKWKWTELGISVLTFRPGAPLIQGLLQFPPIVKYLEEKWPVGPGLFIYERPQQQSGCISGLMLAIKAKCRNIKRRSSYYTNNYEWQILPSTMFLPIGHNRVTELQWKQKKTYLHTFSDIATLFDPSYIIYIISNQLANIVKNESLECVNREVCIFSRPLGKHKHC